MKQPHTEAEIDHTIGPQNTGNHRNERANPGGSDQLGGTRVGAENIEPASPDDRSESIETGTDVDRVSGLDAPNTSTKPNDNPHERHPERDEFGRL